jgi:hypothetical protein
MEIPVREWARMELAKWEMDQDQEWAWVKAQKTVQVMVPAIVHLNNEMFYKKCFLREALFVKYFKLTRTDF